MVARSHAYGGRAAPRTLARSIFIFCFVLCLARALHGCRVARRGHGDGGRVAPCSHACRLFMFVYVFWIPPALMESEWVLALTLLEATWLGVRTRAEYLYFRDFWRPRFLMEAAWVRVRAPMEDACQPVRTHTHTQNILFLSCALHSTPDGGRVAQRTHADGGFFFPRAHAHR